MKNTPQSEPGSTFPTDGEERTLSAEEQQILQELIKPKISMQWLTPAYRQTEKSKGWYALMGLIVLLFVLYGMFMSDSTGWIVSITFLILAAAYYLSEMKPAPVVKVIISQVGVTFGAKFYPYQMLKSFWIIHDETARQLNLTLQKGAHRTVSIIIPEEVNIAQLREDLLLQIPEEEGREESFSDQLIRNLGL